MELLNTLLGIADVRESAAVMRNAYAAMDIPVEPDPMPHINDNEILFSLYRCGTLSARELRMGGPGGVIETSEAIERLARAGLIEADEDGRWFLSEA
jgi:hypothetical protein